MCDHPRMTREEIGAEFRMLERVWAEHGLDEDTKNRLRQLYGMWPDACLSTRPDVLLRLEVKRFGT